MSSAVPESEPPGEEAERSGQSAEKKQRMNPLVELILIIAGAVALAFGIQAWILKPYKIPSGSMEPTLKVGQRIFANRIGMSINGPYVGEIVVFHPPKGAESEETNAGPVCGGLGGPVKFGGAACSLPVPEENTSTNFIKRVVAGPGDEIYISEGHVYRKAAGTSTFVREKDSYIKPCRRQSEITVSQRPPLLPARYATECSFPTPIKIPKGHWFMMGDNREGSDDSRFWGPVPTGWMIAGALATYWPPDRIGLF